MPRLPKSSSTRGRAKGVGSQSKSAQPALEAIKILQRRIENGRVEYQVKWKNHPFGLPTWEPADSVKNLNLIADFEASRKRLILGKLPRVSYRRRNKRYFQEEKNGFQRGLKAERIITLRFLSRFLGVTDITGQLEYLIKFEGCETPEFIPKQIANVQCPLLVLEYYESLLRWDIMVNKDG
ncbi:Chromo and Chromo shadow domain containing protei n [Trichuris trichiura]|uniref:Chromo and Chromo shadow domain containing protei n n=1 Tax=Trichuris trichiura TaxID=36087 RepID=A0A077Z9J3_TRITR|nr:Chromo and Chromo shadow domain containing protei n [Trichuris trichiura]